MVFSGVELAFLAFIFIFALGFFMPLLGARNNISIVKKIKKEKKGGKGIRGQRLRKQVRREKANVFIASVGISKMCQFNCMFNTGFCFVLQKMS